MKNYLVNISGGGIKFVGLLAAFIELTRSGIRPKTVSGVSAGAIVTLLYFTGMLDKGQIISRGLYRGDMIFSKKNNPANRLSAIWKVIRGKNYIGVMDNLEKNIRGIVTRQVYNEALSKSKVDCYIHCVDEQTQNQVSFNLRHLSYEEAISVVIGSATISPIIKTRKCKIGGVEYSLIDGGHRDSSAGSTLLKDGIVDEFDECITIWSRSNPVDHDKTDKTRVNSLFNRLLSVSTMFLRESSLNDEYQEKKECERMGKKHSSIYVRMKSKGAFEITKDEILEGEEVGIKAVFDYIDKR